MLACMYLRIHVCMYVKIPSQRKLTGKTGSTFVNYFFGVFLYNHSKLKASPVRILIRPVL